MAGAIFSNAFLNARKRKNKNIPISPRGRKKIVALIALNAVCITCLGVILSVYGPLMYAEAKYAISSLYDENIKNSKKYADGLPKNVTAGEDLLLEPVVKIPEPKDRNFSVIIPKLGINQHVTSDVDINDKAAVEKALKQGIGWAKGTVEPGTEGNSLLFSHSTQNAWDIWRYNAEFSLLRKLENNDFFTIVYEDRQMDFIVFDKQVVPANDRSYLTSLAKGKIVTLQTCHPPGDDKERLLIRGRLVAMQVK
jgi:LPXTG-site transpeptidase (sortase) family protein